MSAKTVLTIAGSDSSGGAGIEGDLKTMCAFGVFGACAITSITVQDTRSISRIANLAPDLVAAQIDAVMSDMDVGAVKTGMLPTAAIVEAVADALDRHGAKTVIVDPVMVASTGDGLVEDAAVSSMARLMVPRAFLITPNAPEAAVLTGIAVSLRDDMRRAARALCERGAANVLIKAGHLSGEATDVLFDGREFSEFEGVRIPAPETHGTGCALSAAIASGIALGWDLKTAVARAKAYVARAIEGALSLGNGAPCVNHEVRWNTD